MCRAIRPTQTAPAINAHPASRKFIIPSQREQPLSFLKADIIIQLDPCLGL